MINKKSHHPDYTLIAVVLILLVLGILLLASVSSVVSQERFGITTHYLFRQFILGIAPGALFGFIAYKINLGFIKKWAWLSVIFSLILMALVFVPGLGVSSGSAARWLNLRFFTFQPSELLKLTFIIYLASWLSARTEKLAVSDKKSWKNTLVPFLVIIGIIALLLELQSNLSTLMVIAVAACFVYFTSDTPLWHSFFIFFVTAAVGLLFILSSQYRMNRVMVLFDNMKDPMDKSYHLNQALIAVGSGGVFGIGLGESHQKFGFLPETISDSVFAIFAEETGFVGALIMICLFLVFLWRGLKIAKNSQDKFSKLFSVGLTSWICIQAFINMGAMIGILPLTGIPLPFISYGGSHMAMELLGIGVLLNISKSARK